MTKKDCYFILGYIHRVAEEMQEQGLCLDLTLGQLRELIIRNCIPKEKYHKRGD